MSRGQIGLLVLVLGIAGCDRRLPNRIAALEPEFAIESTRSGYLYPVASNLLENFHLYVSVSPDTLAAPAPVPLGSINGGPQILVVKGDLEDYWCASVDFEYAGWTGTVDARLDPTGRSVHLVLDDVVMVDVETYIETNYGSAPLPTDAPTYTLPRLEWEFPIVSARRLFDCPTDFG